MKRNRLDKGHINMALVRYKSAEKREKTRIINEFSSDYGVGRKAVIRAFIGLLKRCEERGYEMPSPTPKALKKPPGRPSTYNNDQVVWWLQTLWVSMRKMNAKAMKEALPHWLKHNKDANFPTEVRDKILSMSASTMERLLSSYKRELARKMRCTTRRPPMKTLRQLIPIHPPGEKLHYNRPGFCQADTVAHCGSHLNGEFANTVNLTDIVTGWTEQEVILNKQAPDVIKCLVQAENRLPFTMWGLHTDNGSEFINELVMRHFDRPRDGVILTRGRAYKKNDQAHIEQKNWTHVRQLFGYHRYDRNELIETMNDIYRNEHRLLQNFFVPQMKQIEKLRTGSQIKKKFDRPQTPFERCLNSKYLSKEEKAELRRTYDELNPFELSTLLDQKLRRLDGLLKKYKIQDEEEQSKQQGDSATEKKAA